MWNEIILYFLVSNVPEQISLLRNAAVQCIIILGPSEQGRLSVKVIWRKHLEIQRRHIDVTNTLLQYISEDVSLPGYFVI
jgi:hypothetical protein